MQRTQGLSASSSLFTCLSKRLKDFLFPSKREIYSPDYPCIPPAKKFWLFSNYQLFSFWKYLTKSNYYFDDFRSGLGIKNFLTNIPGRQGWWIIVNQFSCLCLCWTAQNTNGLLFFNFPGTVYCHIFILEWWRSPTEVSQVPCFTRNHSLFQKSPSSLLPI